MQASLFITFKDLCVPGADLVILLERGGNQLVQQLAEDLAHEQTNRSASSTVGARFREQLRDLIARLDRYALNCCHQSSGNVWKVSLVCEADMRALHDTEASRMCALLGVLCLLCHDHL